MHLVSLQGVEKRLGVIDVFPCLPSNLLCSTAFFKITALHTDCKRTLSFDS